MVNGIVRGVRPTSSQGVSVEADSAAVTPVVLPRAFVGYACQRSLVCCSAPVRAPVPDAERPRLRAALLASNEEGRLIAETLDERLVRQTPSPTSPIVWRHRDDVCLNLDPVHKSCSIHAAAGLGALPTSCRNYPRWIAQVPGEVPRLEVAFALTCPTAAAMLARHDEPFELVPLDDPSWPYGSDKVAPSEPAWHGVATAPLDRVLALREAWWARLAEARSDPARLIATLTGLELDPLGSGLAVADPTARNAIALGAQAALLALERTPVRGASYRAQRARVLSELTREVPPRELESMVGAAPELVAAFASAGVQWLAVHDPRPVSEVAAIVARRAWLVVRLVDALCTLLPYGLTTLFGDAFAASSFVDA